MGETTLKQRTAGGVAEPAPLPTGGSLRLNSIDLMRGLIMVIMALDHVRDYWHHDSLVPKDPTSPTGMSPINPVNLDEADGWLFLTRWVTHFCAPTFVFLAGTGAFLYGSRGRSRAILAGFLLTRGLWLMLLDLTLVRLGWAFFLWGPNENGIWEFGGGIIWVIGAAMVLLSGLVFLPTWAIAAFGVVVIACHNLLDGKVAADVHLPAWIWGALHDPRGGEVVKGVTFSTGYGVLPCLGIMAAGYGFGVLYLLQPAVRSRLMLVLGLLLVGLFVVLRSSNLYGDPPSLNPSSPSLPNPSLPGPWSVRQPWYFTIYSFLNCQKYPPSLLFSLMTLGPAITLLGLFEWAKGPVARFFVVFGRVPLFFYLLHVPLIHGLIVGLDHVRYGWSPQATDGCWSVASRHPPSGYGVNLVVTYLVWVGVVLVLYPLCRWFAGMKQRYRTVWLSYL
jgi:uncharacterized membrane protein